jgi:tetratricopeptide (TPR) repeat protein
MNKIQFFLFLFITLNSFAQQDGYWDKERTTAKQIVVSARERIIIKSEDFPIGTTEVVYRITLLDENQEMASSLVSVLKSIPDPTGISQGSAGAVFLLSKVSGDDKCKYGIFTTNKAATSYKQTGKTEQACLFQNNPINKEAKLLSVDKLACLQPNTTNIYFGFESKNLIMNQKIVLEIVPWIDNKLSRGWNIVNKKILINQCKSSETAKKLANSDNFCVCELEKIQEKYKFQEFQNLLPLEKSKLMKDIEATCLKETGENLNLDDSIRTEISILENSGKYDLAIIEMNQNIINKSAGTAMDYNNLGKYYLFTKQYQKAMINIKKAETMDNSELLIKLNLAHAYLLIGDVKQAKVIHDLYKSQNVTATQTWINKTQMDLLEFEKAGLPSQNFKKIIRLFDN